jgi:putative tricarboxylic transport membrane protein
MSDVISNLQLGFSAVLTPNIILWAVIGCALGMITGVLPGFGPAAATGLLLPFAFVLPPTASIVMLACIYYGSMYGGTITSVLLNVPGEASSVATCIDGYAMTKRGMAGKALAIAAVGSFIGGAISVFGLIFSHKIASFAISFTYLDVFGFTLLALTLVVGLTGDSMVKGLISAFLGLFVGMVGLDIYTGGPRFTMGLVQLQDGIPFIAIIMGIFGLSEILASIGGKKQPDFSGNIGSTLLKWQDFKDSFGSIMRGTGIGFFFGLVPGSPAAACSFASYTLEKRISKTPEKFGKGAIQGVAGPETANNALGISNFIPLLALGIPSSATMAILLAAFTINGLTPGPLLFVDHPDIAWGLIASLAIANAILLIMAFPLVKMWVSILRIPTMVLYTITLCFMSLGAYLIDGRMFTVFVLWVAGLIGFTLRRFNVPMAPAALTLVLGPMLEKSFRTALQVNYGEFSSLFSSTRANVAYVLIVIILGTKIFSGLRKHSLAKKMKPSVAPVKSGVDAS